MTAKSRKELLRRDDAFILAAEQSASWAAQHKNKLLAAFAVVLVLCGGVLGTWEIMHVRERDASITFGEGWRIIEAGRITEAEDQAPAKAAKGIKGAPKAKTIAKNDPAAKPAANSKDAAGAKAKTEASAKGAAKAAPDAGTQEDGEQAVDSDVEVDTDAPVFATKNAKWQAALEKFQAVAERMGTRGVGGMASLMVGDLQAKLDDKAAAKQTFDALRTALKPGDRLYFLASERAAYLREAEGDIEGALGVLDTLAQDDKLFYSDYAQVHQARLHLAKNDAERAKTLLQHVEHAFPHSSLADDVRTQLIELGVAPDDLHDSADSASPNLGVQSAVAK